MELLIYVWKCSEALEAVITCAEELSQQRDGVAFSRIEVFQIACSTRMLIAYAEHLDPWITGGHIRYATPDRRCQRPASDIQGMLADHDGFATHGKSTTLI